MRNAKLTCRPFGRLFLWYNTLQILFAHSKTDENMPRRGDICQHFNSSMFRYYLRKKYKNHKTFAKRMGVSFQAVYAWENGDHKPTWSHVIKMADIFNISPRRLLGKTGQHVLQKWDDHLIDFLMEPPEVKKSIKVDVTDDSEYAKAKAEEVVKIFETKTERSLKISEKVAIELAEKLGYFDDTGDTDDDNKSENPLHDILKD